MKLARELAGASVSVGLAVALVVFGLDPKYVVAQIPVPPGPVSIDPYAKLRPQIIDLGYPGFHQFVDVNGDGITDYCRFVGPASAPFLSCQMGSAPGYLSSKPYNYSGPSGMQMGGPPWAILGSWNNVAPAYCRFVSVSVKHNRGCGGHLPPGSNACPIETMADVGLALRCDSGTPPSNPGTHKFYNDDYNPCKPDDTTAALLTEASLIEAPYLLCDNSKTGVWAAERTDENGLTWQVRGFVENSKKAGWTSTVIRLDQLTYKVPGRPHIYPTKQDSHKEFPARYILTFTVNRDKSTSLIITGYGAQSDVGHARYDSAFESVKQDITPTHGGGFTVSLTHDKCGASIGSCVVVASHKGFSPDGTVITWSGGPPSQADLHVAADSFMSKFSQVQLIRARTFEKTLQALVPSVASKTPDQWTVGDRELIAHSLVEESGGALTPSGQDALGAARATVLTIHVSWGLFGYIALHGICGPCALALDGAALLSLGYSLDVASDAIMDADWKECKNNPKKEGCEKYYMKN